MKFILIVLAIHFIGELIGEKFKNRNNNEAPAEDEAQTLHPAEFDIR